MILKNTLTAEKSRAELSPLELEQRKLQIKGQMEDEKMNQSVALSFVSLGASDFSGNRASFSQGICAAWRPSLPA